LIVDPLNDTNCKVPKFNLLIACALAA